MLVSKFSAIDSILVNQTLCDLKQKLEDDNKKNQSLDVEIKELQTLKNIASQRAKRYQNDCGGTFKRRVRKSGFGS